MFHDQHGDDRVVLFDGAAVDVGVLAEGADPTVLEPDVETGRVNSGHNRLGENQVEVAVLEPLELVLIIVRICPVVVFRGLSSWNLVGLGMWTG